MSDDAVHVIGRHHPSDRFERSFERNGQHTAVHRVLHSDLPQSWYAGSMSL